MTNKDTKSQVLKEKIRKIVDELDCGYCETSHDHEKSREDGVTQILDLFESSLTQAVKQAYQKGYRAGKKKGFDNGWLKGLGWHGVENKAKLSKELFGEPNRQTGLEDAIRFPNGGGLKNRLIEDEIFEKG
jgi:hypothetical protein